MSKRIVIAGLLGGVAMFLWSFLAHMVLPLGEAGIKELSNEQALLATMQSTAGAEAGLYMFPGMGLGPNPTRQQQRAAMQAYEEKLARNPSGLLIYNPPGATGLTARRLITEFLTEVAESLLAAFLLSLTRLTAFSAKVGFVVLAGVLAIITTNVSYWNWYSFPAVYTAAYMTTEFLGYLCAGLVIAGVMKTSAVRARAAAA